MGNETSSVDTGSGNNQFEYNPNHGTKVIKFLTADNKHNLNTERVEEIKRKHESHFEAVDETTTNEDFYNYRNKPTEESALKCLNELGTCVNDIDTKSAKKYLFNGINEKILFMICNNYTKPEYKLGTGPLNDAITVAIHHKKMGYNIVFLHNSTPVIFKKWLKFNLQNTESDLTIFYTGHGSQLRDRSGDESDGYDEVMIFDDGYVVDDELASYLVNYAHGQRIVLLTDCCHSGSIWDIQSILAEKEKVAPNIISISAAQDNQTSKQTRLDSRDQGIFTYFFWHIFEQNPHITTNQMKEQIDAVIKRFNQKLDYATTSEGMADQPIFPNKN